jgi:hypothetical protein
MGQNKDWASGKKRKKREGSWLVGFVKEIEGGELGLNKRMCGLG